MSDIAARLDKAFDYRGDVTLELKDGTQIVGFVCNRYPKGTSSDREPRAEVMVEGHEDKIIVRYIQIQDVHFTGEDTAAGKSWEAYQAKQAAKKAAKL